MAVESNHLCLLPSYFPPTIVSSSPPAPPDLFGDFGNQLGLCDAASAMGFAAPVAGSVAGCLMQLCAVPPAAAASDSGLTHNEAGDAAAAQQPRKRQRLLVGGSRTAAPVTFLGEDLSPYMQQQQIEIDRLIAIHVGRIRAEVLERGKRTTRQVLAAVESAVARRLRSKDEEVERISKLNSALEERVRSLYAENMVWRDLARSSEAAANLLRCNLEQVLAAEQFRAAAEDDPAAADAESCCGDSDEERKAATAERHTCRCCGSREAAVLILPCRHLCVCSACSPATAACPVCKCNKDGSVGVNLS